MTTLSSYGKPARCGAAKKDVSEASFQLTEAAHRPVDTTRLRLTEAAYKTADTIPLRLAEAAHKTVDSLSASVSFLLLTQLSSIKL